MAKEKILIIDDDPVVVRMIEVLLRSNDYEIIRATDGAAGFQKAKEERPDLILLDIILPQMHGLELCKELKNDKATQQIPVVMMSGTGLEEVVRNEQEIKAEAFLSKPFGLPELLAAIAKAKGRIKESQK